MLSDEAVDLFGNGSQTFHGCGMRADQPCEIFRLDFFSVYSIDAIFLHTFAKFMAFFLKKSDYGQK